MARILFTWEAGLNKSHLSNIAMIARPLVEQAHTVAVAARELQGTHDFFAGMPIQYYQAPFKQGEPPELPHYQSYAHVLYTAGYAEARELTVLLSAWLGVLYSFAPDIILFDHSPTALLASRVLKVKRFVIGSGFLVPPVEPVLGLFPHTSMESDVIESLNNDEQVICDTVNQAIQPYGIEPINQLSDIYAQADGELILSYPELDPFGERNADNYYGVWSTLSGEAPIWPDGGKKNVFAYLNDFPACETLLSDLRMIDANVLIYASGIPKELINQCASERMQFTDGLVDLDQMAEKCDLFISHGAHTSVARMLLNGVPQLMIPNYNEQLFTADKVKDLGAGLVVDRNQASFIEPLKEILGNQQYQISAQKFSGKYVGDDIEVIKHSLVSRITAS